jgi:hypothetical protein
MKICGQCGQIVAEEVATCPDCGFEVAAGRVSIDDVRILEVLHEGYSSILCKGRRDNEETPLLIRIFTPPSGIDEHLADRLKSELEKLQALPETCFVHHLAIKQSADGHWYRISEWVEALKWGNLLSGGRLVDPGTCLHLFYQIASILDRLHRSGHIIPHLNLDDILVYEDDAGDLKVKIDYKLSRFLDPRLDRPGPMLARLLALHPDIINCHPLDHRSDIWSLGKTFVEILSADPEVEDLHAEVDNLPVPSEIRTLIRLMLSDNPDLRPQSMAEVCAALNQVDDTAIRAAVNARDEKDQSTTRALMRRVNVRMGLFASVLTAIIVAGGILWYNLSVVHQDSDKALMGYANQYAGSVAFVMVDYWLQQGGHKVYRNRAEGTAFLADDKGYLLTSRHVACPWLEDGRLFMLINVLQQQPEPLQFDYRIYLWFDGQRAFSRLPDISGSDDVEDIYVTESAYSSQGPRRVWIAGAAPVPAKTRERVRSPLHDDFAVLKIDPVPPELQALPLAESFKTTAIPKLTPLIALGFPLGSQTQAATVNVSVTSGHVRRTFENMFQVDVSLHPGNSGGPFVNTRGRVVGLAANVAVGWARGPLPMATPLSDIGLVLPITKALSFLREVKTGKVKWNGEIDVALEERMQGLTTVLGRRKWEKARDLADKELEGTRTPVLVMAVGVIHLCAGDHDGAHRLFDQVLSIDPERNMARLMILVTDWLEERELTGIHKQSLTSLDWRSPDEFLGYLAKILAGKMNAGDTLTGGYNPAEKSWLNLIAGLIEARAGKTDLAWTLLENAALTADVDDWSRYLSLAQLDRLQHKRMTQTSDLSVQQKYRLQIEAFNQQLEQTAADKQNQRAKLAPIKSALQGGAADLVKQRSLLNDLRTIDNANNDLLIAQAYYAAMDEDWDAALQFTRAFIALPGRENAGKLSIGLLEPEILHKQGHTGKARETLETYHQRVSDPWYRNLSACLLDPALQADVTAKAGESAENLLTGHTALGLWAEGSGDATSAIRHYREALGSYLDNRIEYDFAMARIKRLRRPVE